MGRGGEGLADVSGDGRCGDAAQRGRVAEPGRKIGPQSGDAVDPGHGKATDALTKPLERRWDQLVEPLRPWGALRGDGGDRRLDRGGIGAPNDGALADVVRLKAVATRGDRRVQDRAQLIGQSAVCGSAGGRGRHLRQKRCGAGGLRVERLLECCSRRELHGRGDDAAEREVLGSPCGQGLCGGLGGEQKGGGEKDCAHEDL